MGETMALWYLSTTAGPKVLYGSEMISDTDKKVQKELGRWWIDMVSKAVGVSSVSDKLKDFAQRPTSYVSMRSLAKETNKPPWSVTQTMKKVGLLHRVTLSQWPLREPMHKSPKGHYGHLWRKLVSRSD